MQPKIILGIDEVGRGPWAGPLVIGAVILPPEHPDWTAQLTDSKKLSPKKRQELAKIIHQAALATSLGWVSARELDATGLSDALKLATRRAVKQIRMKKVPFTEIIIDGTVNFLAGTPLASYVTILKKADLLIKEVSAASIIAKVARDEYMKQLATIYPGYGFEKHVGYGTAAHKSALLDLGPTPEHRTSFRPIAALLSQDQPIGSTHKQPAVKNTTKIGNQAEQVVADYLENSGHQIVAKNHKTRFYEIDIISISDDKIYFTEVKYRKSQNHGSSLEAITPEKRQQMQYAAESFLQYSHSPHQPILAAAAVSGEDFHLDDWFPLYD